LGSNTCPIDAVGGLVAHTHGHIGLSALLIFTHTHTHTRLLLPLLQHIQHARILRPIFERRAKTERLRNRRSRFRVAAGGGLGCLLGGGKAVAVVVVVVERELGEREVVSPGARVGAGAGRVEGELG
jgi:hypothetical protein